MFPSSSCDLTCLSHASFKANAQQLLSFNCKLHGKLAKHALAEAVDDHGDSIFGCQSSLPQIEELVFTDFRCRRFVLHTRGRVSYVNVREGMCAALIADQQRVALRVVAGAGCSLQLL